MPNVQNNAAQMPMVQHTSLYTPATTENKKQKSIQNQNNGDLLCQICFKEGHTALRCWNWFSFACQANDCPQPLAAIQMF